MAGRRISAGIALYRIAGERPEVLLAHPGGPLWAGRDDGAWSIPKGEVDDGDADPLAAAIREFTEEVGTPPPPGPFVDLGRARLRSGKTVLAWAVAGDLDPATATSETFELEWPPRSGRRQRFPEVDRVAWFALDAARDKINPGQLALLDALAAHLGG